MYYAKGQRVGGDTDAGPVEVDLLLAGGWPITMNERREVYRDGAVAVSGTTILEVGQRSDLETRYRASASCWPMPAFRQPKYATSETSSPTNRSLPSVPSNTFRTSWQATPLPSRRRLASTRRHSVTGGPRPSLARTRRLCFLS